MGATTVDSRVEKYQLQVGCLEVGRMDGQKRLGAGAGDMKEPTLFPSPSPTLWLVSPLLGFLVAQC